MQIQKLFSWRQIWIMDINNGICVEELVREIRKETEKETDDPFLTAYYFDFIRRLSNVEEIVIVGAGNYGRDLYKVLEQHGVYTVKCFADNMCERYKNGVYRNRVLSLADATIQYKNAYFVVTPQNYIMELIRQLIGLGINVDKIDCFIIGNTGLIM